MTRSCGQFRRLTEVMKPVLQMSTRLGDLFPDGDASADALLERFLDYTAGKGLTLYPAQEEAVLELLDEKNVILNTPTGSGKSLVASAMLFAALARGQRAIYTCPSRRWSTRSGWRSAASSALTRWGWPRATRR